MRRILVPAFVLLASCGTSTPPPDGATSDAGHRDALADADATMLPDVPPQPVAPAELTVTPAMATLDVPSGAHPTQRFTVNARYADGHTEMDVPASLSMDTVGLGTFNARTFTASGTSGGVANVTAFYNGTRGGTRFTVRLLVTAHQDGVSDAAAQAAVNTVPNAADDPALRPTIAYPYDGTVMPPNLYRVEWQWLPVPTADLYVTTFASPTAVVSYVSTGNRFVLPPDAWSALVTSNRGLTVAVTVRAARLNDPGHAGAATVHVTFGVDDLLGGLYYFTTNETDSDQGIFRYDFGTPVASATRFLSRSGPGTCVGCHALSRDGSHTVVSFEGGYGYFAALATSDPSRYLFGGPAGPQRGAFAGFFDSDQSLLAVYDNGLGPEGVGGDPSDPLTGQVLVYDAATGVEDPARRLPLAAGHRAAHVTVAPDGLTVAYTDYVDVANRPIHETQGSIALITYDPTARAWGAPRVLVPFDGTSNNYYPNVSPDGQWVLFNRAPGDAYDNPDASLWVVPADGSRPPLELASAEGAVPHAHNSWPRWAPFVQLNELGTARLWITFSSKRDYGVELVGQQRAQLWMAAFDAVTAAQGRDGSAPAFWLPFQDLATKNHTAAWTERVAPRSCQRDSDCADPTLRCDGLSHTCVTITPPG